MYREIKNLYPDLTNEEVIVKFQTGQCPFEQVIIRFHKLLWKKANGKHISGYDKEDFYQELVEKLHYCCCNWNPKSDQLFITWLFPSLDNHIAWIFRKQGTSDKRKANFNSASYEYLVDNGYDRVDSQVMYQDLLVGLTLSEKERMCIELVFDGYLKADIADMLHISRTRVTHIFKGLQSRFQFMLEATI